MSPESTPPISIPMAEFYAEHVHSHIHSSPRQTLEKYRHRIDTELALFGISSKQLRDKTILDIGSGWQAIVFHELGCRKIHHLDINPRHVEFLNCYAAEHGINNIISETADICRSLGSAQSIDLAFVAGVYHHLDDREAFIDQLLSKMNAGGDILFRIYRSGTWSRWLVAALRGFSVGRFVPESLLAAYRALRPYGEDNQFIGDMIDDLLTPQWLAFHPDQFRVDAKRIGLDCRCLTSDFTYDFSDQDENFRVEWHLTASRATTSTHRLSTGLDHDDKPPELPTNYHDLATDLDRLLTNLEHQPKRDAALVLVGLYFLARHHRNVDAFSGRTHYSSPPMNIETWRIDTLRHALTHYRTWLAL